MSIGESCVIVFRPRVELSVLHKQIVETWPDNGFTLDVLRGKTDWILLFLNLHHHPNESDALRDLVVICKSILKVAHYPVFYLTDSNHLSSFDDITEPHSTDVIVRPGDLWRHYPGSDFEATRYRLLTS